MIRSLSIAFAAVALSACVSVLPEPEAPDGLYRFGTMTETYPVDAVVAVREPEASRLLGGRVIVSENTAGALRLVRDVEWADNATRLMQVALLDAVNDAGAGVAVAYESGARADYELVWRIEDFSLAGTQRAAAWRVRWSRRGPARLSRRPMLPPRRRQQDSQTRRVRSRWQKLVAAASPGLRDLFLRRLSLPNRPESRNRQTSVFQLAGADTEDGVERAGADKPCQQWHQTDPAPRVFGPTNTMAIRARPTMTRRTRSIVLHWS